MAKKYYLIQIWDAAGPQKKKLNDIMENEHDGFNLLQKKVIQCYENNIKNLYVVKGLRATYEEVEKPKETAKTSRAAK